MSTETDAMLDQLPALVDMAAQAAEPLHPDLQPYLTETNMGLRLLAHPLVHHVMPINGQANRAYAYKSEALAKAEEAGEWHTVVFLHERPYRCEALIDYVLGRHDEDDTPFSLGEMLGRDDYTDIADVAADVWTDSENIHQHVDDWLAITQGHVPGAPLLMGDQPAFDALPSVGGAIEVWRGDCDDGGWSWTTERKVAEFFAQRWGAGHDLLHGFVDKRYVFGYLTARSEFEVMVRREHVRMASVR